MAEANTNINTQSNMPQNIAKVGVNTSSYQSVSSSTTGYHYSKLAEEFGALLAVLLLVFFVVKWDRGRRPVQVVKAEEDDDVEETLVVKPIVKKEQKEEHPPENPFLQEVPIKPTTQTTQTSVALLAVSVRVKDIKKSDSVAMWFKQASCYWVGEERAWQKVLANLRKRGVNAQEPIFLKEVETQEDNFDVIIVYRSIFWRAKPRLDTFLAVVNVVRDASPNSKEVDYYCYPRELNLLNKEFGFRKA